LETISRVKLSKRQREILRLVNEIGCFFGIVPCYSRRDIYLLWKNSGLTYDEVARHFYRSRERAIMYCYGQSLSDRLKIQVANLFKSRIYG
jgi:hypothetical protein